jgi:hypothetical protein
MLWNENKKLMNPLRTRKVQPSFEEIRDLVLKDKRKSFIFFPVRSWMYLALGILVLVAPSILLFPKFFGLQRSVKTSANEAKLPNQIYNTQNEHSAPIYHHTQIRSLVQPSQDNAVADQKIVENEVLNNPNKMVVQPKKPQNNKPEEDKTVADKKIAKEEVTDNSDKKIDQSEKLQIKNPAESSAMLVQQPSSEFMINQSESRKFYTFISGGFPTSQSTVPFSNRLSYSAGIGYSINSSSSFLLELRRNIFINRYAASKTIFHDTIIKITNNIDTTKKSVGVTSSYQIESPYSFWGVSAGFRYSFIHESKLTPFGEFQIGGSARGGLTSEMIGLQYAFNPFGIEIGLRSDQLFSSGSSPQNVFNANMGISYSW